MFCKSIDCIFGSEIQTLHKPTVMGNLQDYPIEEKKVNGYVKSKVIPFLSKKKINSEKIENRTVLLSNLTGTRSLNQPSLISSIDGKIGQILFTIPDCFFFPEPGDVLTTNITNIFKHLLKSLPPKTGLILTQEKSKDKLKEWVNELGITVNTIFIKNNESVNLWAEDSFCVCHDNLDDEQYIVKPHTSSKQQIEITTNITQETPYKKKEIDLFFQGGNILVGDDFWFIGKDCPQDSINDGIIKVAKDEKEDEKEKIIKEVYQNALDPERKLFIIQSREDVPTTSYETFVMKEEEKEEKWEQIFHRGNEDGTKQPLFHIDMFISLAGRDNQNNRIILVGDPLMADKLLGKSYSREENLSHLFDDIAQQLKLKGFKVIRNPMPHIYDDDDDDKIRYWYYASANNVIVQNYENTKKVWLPTYGYGLWQELKRTDEVNKTIWEDLGYEVEMVPNCHPLAIKNGVLHCISKYLYRISSITNPQYIKKQNTNFLK